MPIPVMTHRHFWNISGRTGALFYSIGRVPTASGHVPLNRFYDHVYNIMGAAGSEQGCYEKILLKAAGDIVNVPTEDEY